MDERTLVDVLTWTPILVTIWFVHRERAAVLRTLQSLGLPVAAPPADLPAELPPEADIDRLADVEVLSVTSHHLDGGGLRLRLEVSARARLAKQAEIRVGLLDPDGASLDVPDTRFGVRFLDDQETLGGTLETPFALTSDERWADLELVLPAQAFLLGLPERPQVRIQVTIDGKREADARQALEVS